MAAKRVSDEALVKLVVSRLTHGDVFRFKHEAYWAEQNRVATEVTADLAADRPAFAVKYEIYLRGYRV